MSVKIEVPNEEIAAFCRRHHIRKLAFFGSVLRDDFTPASDVDVLVEFEPDARHTLFTFVEMQEELSEMFGRKVDLVQKGAVTNPFVRHHIRHHHQTLYDAA